MSLPECITLGETMVAMAARTEEPLEYGGELRMRIAGAESNTATGLARLSHPSMFVSRVGDDPFGRFILRGIRAEGVDVSRVAVDPDFPTGIMFKDWLPGGETAVHYYRSGSAASRMTPQDVPEDAIRQAKLLHLSGITPVLSESCQETVLAALETAQAADCPVSFDPNIRKRLWKDMDYSPLMRAIAAGSDILLTGLDEARTLYGCDDISGICRKAFAGSRLQVIAVKDGGRGAWVCSHDEIIHIPPFPCRCIDPVGAGDAFNAGFLAGMLEGKPLELCGRMGGTAGARATETRGDIEGLVTARQLHDILNHVSAVQR